MKLLVTGAAGDFGRDLVPWLAKRHDVRATDILPITYDCECVVADLRDPEQVRGLVQGIDAVIHLAVLLPRDYPTADFVDVNVKASTLLCEAAVAAKVSRMVYISTVWATGHGLEEGYLPVDEQAPCYPQEMYGLTKLQGELSVEYYARMVGLSSIVLRMCGYVRCPQFAPDGTVDLATADLAEIAAWLLRSGQKLHSPNDLGRLMESATSAEGIGFERVIAGNSMPWSPADAAQLAAAPTPVIDRCYPGAAGMFAALDYTPAPIPFWYSTAAAEKLLGLRNELTISDLVRAWREHR
jgi:UDP-glucose 4-epimerase